jgi:glycosyltransferase involved in cell wall biosynthesis
MRFEAAARALVTMHDAFAFTQPHPERIARWREQAPIRRAARLAARIVTVSRWSRGELARELGLASESIAVVTTPPDAFFFPAADDVVPPPLDAERFVLVVGAGEARKNVRLALEACARG